MEINTRQPGGLTNLDSDDLLMSFDEVDERPARNSSSARGAHPPTDMFSDVPDFGSSSRRSVETSPTRSLNRSLRGRRSFSTFTGPSSPPRVSEAGADIIFHSPHRVGNHSSAAKSLRRMSSQGSPLDFERSLTDDPLWAYSGSSRPPTVPESSDSSSNRPRSLVDALSASKLATRWKRSVLGPNIIQQLGAEPEPPSRTAVPIDISHTSPFATRDQIAGTYVAPTGAPGFRDTGGGRWDEDSESSGPKLAGRQESTTPVLSQAQAEALRPHLPARQRIYDTWRLLFSLDQHGASLSSLYREAAKYAEGHQMAGSLLVARDMENHVFGVYLNEPIAKREGTYYGSGEAFMFKFVDGESKPRIFPWTGLNQYIALCEANFISFGGGGTSYGLLLDGTFSRNSSATSPAFQNEVLCSDSAILSEKGQSFDCLGLEVWATA
ncbi:uncharacterized protein CcaverHIS019_0405470 [Cutaneotrichosporon cavernicola]|uniref:Oxidation resistance protein 1 n=1 Tax=Cutaneotrichosporon cavernicola TaxID=279322 RepID=A0AA48QW20_9TREE|nr:uncharacterized protein CcaverHIS019_0405470 [Cutaneotrichosporon cavernicola]BEI91727.1 hypothetical protein CcaverHIS019_0405470 [Cutaneotrichosporon cavernicola]BEJ07278.1 hypothetical protein CcaverHIS641_0405470 [Cutaneotrichosporon cavernicola]